AIYQLPWLALLNVRYWVVPRPMPPTDFPAGWFRTLRGASAGSAGVVYEGRLVSRGAVGVGAWGGVPATGGAGSGSCATVVHNPAVFTYVTRDPGMPSGKAEPAGSATITRYALHQVSVDVDAARPALLRLADLWYPDWKVTVDGKPATLLRADHVLRAVAVPAGHHTVRFTYASTAFRLGLWVSIVSTVLSLLLLAAGVWLARRPIALPPVAPPAGAKA